MAFKSPNQNQGSSAYVERVTAGAGSTFASKPATVEDCTAYVVLVAAGNLSFVNRYGNTIGPVALPAGSHPIEAQAINAATNVDVICYF